jgi:hypothetical protein
MDRLRDSRKFKQGKVFQEDYQRLCDRQGHFIGKIQGNRLYIYCKRCHELKEIRLEVKAEIKR